MLTTTNSQHSPEFPPNRVSEEPPTRRLQKTVQPEKVGSRLYTHFCSFSVVLRWVKARYTSGLERVEKSSGEAQILGLCVSFTGAKTI